MWLDVVVPRFPIRASQRGENLFLVVLAPCQVRERDLRFARHPEEDLEGVLRRLPS